MSIILSIIVNFFNKNTPSLKATKIYKNQVVIFCFCSNEMQPCRIWGAKQKLNPIANNPCLYTLHFKLLYIPLAVGVSSYLLPVERLLVPQRNSCWLMLLLLLF